MNENGKKSRAEDATASQSGTDRRSVLKMLGIGTVGGAAVAAGGESAAAEVAATTSDTGGYRESEHVKTYYDRARF